MSIRTLDEKFSHEVGDIYDAENQFLQAMQQMLPMATDQNLKGMIQQHIQQTQQQIQNIEQIYSLLGQQPQRVKCQAAAGLVAEAQKTVQEAETPELRDCLIAGSQAKSEHYEVASYRGLIAGAQMMGNNEILRLLQQNLQQEEQTAQMIEQNTPTLLQKAMSSQEMGA
jgi:ferritin-like metal-binding protein YciE